MALNFPDSPTTGDEFTGGGFTWVWTGSTWSKVAAAVGGSNDFALLVGNTGNTTYVLDRTYTSGRYTIDFVNDDTTYDIYFVAENGTYAGYTNGTVAEVSADFTEVVVIGAANGETILFNYDGTLTSPSSAGDVPVAGAFLSATSESSLPDIDDFTVLTGGNFATDVAVAFIGQDEVVVAAKSVVRSSSTELLATRPDAFPTAQSPYSVRVLNPGIPAPTGTNAHILSNAINAGTNPVWVTDGDLLYNLGAATPDITLVATDTEGSDIDYSVVSGTIPVGLTLNGETGVISGTFSGSASEGDSNSVTFRATDAGGNFLDKALNFVANAAPTWTTPAGALDDATEEGEYSFQLVASTGSAGGALTYTLQSGALLPGHTLSSTGLISGTSTGVAGDSATFTIRATDAAGLFADREFSVAVVTGESLVLLASYNGDSSGSSFTISNIPQTAKHLRIMVRLRLAAGLETADMGIRFNGASNDVYTNYYMGIQDSQVISSNLSAYTNRIYVQQSVPGNDYPGEASYVLEIQNYTEAGAKTFSMHSALVGGNGGQPRAFIVQGGTASYGPGAINSITFGRDGFSSTLQLARADVYGYLGA